MTLVHSGAQEGSAVPGEGHGTAVVSLEQAEADDRAARKAYGEARLALSSALDDVRKRHNPLIDAARVAAAVTARQLALAQSAAAPDHEWEGRAVTGPKGTWGLDARETVGGVVFTYRPGVDLGRGHSYSRPEVGEAFVRLFRKDGTPGAKTVRMHAGFALTEARTAVEGPSVGIPASCRDEPKSLPTNGDSQ